MIMAQHARSLENIPFLGSGIGYRLEIRDKILEHSDEIDFVEVITEQYANKTGMWGDLERVGERLRVIPHGVRLSIGSSLPLDMDYLRSVKQIVALTKAPFYSEHLCVTRAPGIDIGHLSPLWFTGEILHSTTDKVNRIQDYLGLPLALENVTYTFEIPDSPLRQTEFFRRLVDATGCGVLLDVTNVYINSVNFGFDPEAFFDEMPLDHVIQLHLAGGFWADDRLIDGHCAVVQEGSWDLLAMLARKAGKIRGSILEHDENFPESFDLLLDTVRRTREVMGWPRARTAEPAPALLTSAP